MTLCDNIFASPVGCTVPWFKLNVLVYSGAILKPEPFAVIIKNFVSFPLYWAEILQGPMSQLAPLNSTVTFFCHARGDLVLWYINGDTVDYRNRDSLVQRGFRFENINEPPEVTKTMSVPATLQNNNTNIDCRVTLLGQGQQNATANLLVAGKQ